MIARRKVWLAAGDKTLTAAARRNVHRAKVALGERGRVWWKDGDPDYSRRKVTTTPYADWFNSLGINEPSICDLASISDAQIKKRILKSLAQRKINYSCCPSEVARSFAQEAEVWRALMPRIREIAAKMALEGQVILSRGIRSVSVGDIRGGPIRIRRGSHFHMTKRKK